jgi:hypothetical protein
MAKQLDVYRDWLQIQDAERPLNYYQLLRLKKFEDDTAKIREHYRKLNAHVRKFAAGEFAKQSQDLLNELAKAMLCLTDRQRKEEYDITLGRPKTSKDAIGRRSLEQILLGRKLVDQEKLAKARTYAMAVGVEIRDALVQQRIVPADVVAMAFAESEGLSYLDLGDIEFDELLAKRVPAIIARQHSLVPVMIDNNQLLIASPAPIDPHVEDELRLRIGLPVRTVLCTPTAVHDIVNRYYTKEAAAAEMAAGGGASSNNKPAARREATPDKPLTVEEIAEREKRRRSATIIAFNFGGMLTMFALKMGTNIGTFKAIVLTVLVAGVAATVTWFVSPKHL